VIRAKLLQKVSQEEATSILSDVMSQFNSMAVGSIANSLEKPKKELVPEPKAKKILPDPETIIPQTKEILGFFEGSKMDVEIDPPSNVKGLEVTGLFNREGISEVL
jgi:hypothetical protein